MKVTYIYHSCFSIELEHTILVFDYFKGELKKLDKNKNLYVFSSHKHYDHFSLDIFEKFKEYPNVMYILSNDIKLNEQYLERNGVNPKVKEKIINVKANESYDMSGLKIKTLKSTDAGVAFCIEVEGKSIYYAGDLNWWHWTGESEEYNIQMEKDFKKELEAIKGESFDVAFLPADGRQEECFCWGFDYFMKLTDTKIAFPMHFWEDYTVVDRLENVAKEQGYDKKLYSVRREGQEWEI